MNIKNYLLSLLLLLPFAVLAQDSSEEDVEEGQGVSDIASVKSESTKEKPDDAESGEETSLKEETPSTTLEENDENPDPVSENTESREQEKLKASGD